VSYERVLSGPGLFNIYRFLKESRGMEEPSWLAEHFSAGDDASATISKAALAGKAEICVKALDLFVSIYGAEAGNMALRFKSIRGLYVGGGIAPKILDKLKDGTFMRSFIDKGRYTELLAAMPVQVVLNPQAGLRGAGYYAAFLSGEYDARVARLSLHRRLDHRQHASAEVHRARVVPSADEIEERERGEVQVLVHRLERRHQLLVHAQAIIGLAHRQLDAELVEVGRVVRRRTPVLDVHHVIDDAFVRVGLEHVPECFAVGLDALRDDR